MRFNSLNGHCDQRTLFQKWCSFYSNCTKIKVTNVYTFIETTTSTTIAPTTKTAGIYVFLLHNSSH